MSSQSNTQKNTGSAIKVVAILFAITVSASLINGCQSAGSSQALSVAVADYNAKHYLSAQRRSARVAKNSSGTLKDQATYLSGLSSYKLGDLSKAEAQLAIASKSPDQSTAGRAKAVLGLIRVDQHRPSDAAGLLSEASNSMRGEDSRQAAYQASLAHVEAGSEVPAYLNSQISSHRSSQDWSGKAKAFSLQVGAFLDLGRAKNAAQNIAGIAQANDLGNVRIVKNRDDRGRALYIVQLGSFSSRYDARDIHRQIGRKDLIVAPQAIPTL